MRFTVRAISKENEIVEVLFDAADESDAKNQATTDGLYVVHVKRNRSLDLDSFFVRSANSRFDLVLFSRELLALLVAGLGIVESLETLVEKESNKNRRTSIERILRHLNEGNRLSTSLAEQPEVFSQLYIGVIRAAEGTSDLPKMLQRFIDYQLKIDMLRSKVISAAIYPSILAIVGGCVTLFLVIFVVPKFADVYNGSGRELPMLTSWMLQIGASISANWAPFVTSVIIGLVALSFIVRQLYSKGVLTRYLANIPSVGANFEIYTLSRIYTTLGMLLEGGIPVVPAITTISNMSIMSFKKNLEQARLEIERGMPLSSAFLINKLTTPISLRMIRVGERSGQLGPMLTQSASFYDEQLVRWIERFTRAFEPLLMAAIGLIVGIIVVLLYMPIFDLAGNL